MRGSGEERRATILHEVMARGQVTVAELAERLGVTTETVRKDLTILEEKGAVSKGHGIVVPASSPVESAFSEKKAQRAEEKAAIALHALALVAPGSSIFLDTSTTVLALAKLLVMRDDLTVITNSLDICQALSRSGNELLMIGGSYRKRSNSCVGAWALAAADELNVDVAFLGADGISATGPTVRSYRELRFKGLMAARSARSALVLDTSKLSHCGLYTFATWNDLDTLVCERPLADEERARLPHALDVLPRA